MITKKRRSAKNPETSVKKYGVVPVETIVHGKGNVGDYVWVEQKQPGRGVERRPCPVHKITPTHVVIQTLHTGIYLPSVSQSTNPYRDVKIEKKTGKFVGVEENVRVVMPPA